MIYADTDFFVALLNDDDGLQGRTEAIARNTSETSLPCGRRV